MLTSRSDRTLRRQCHAHAATRAMQSSTVGTRLKLRQEPKIEQGVFYPACCERVISCLTRRASCTQIVISEFNARFPKAAEHGASLVKRWGTSSARKFAVSVVTLQTPGRHQVVAFATSSWRLCGLFAGLRFSHKECDDGANEHQGNNQAKPSQFLSRGGPLRGGDTDVRE